MKNNFTLFVSAGKDHDIEVTGTFRIDNDGIGGYEYWGQKCYDYGTDSIEVDEVDCNARLLRMGICKSKSEMPAVASDYEVLNSGNIRWKHYKPIKLSDDFINSIMDELNEQLADNRSEYLER